MNSTRLKASDCNHLVERITKRIKSWTNKCLSYAGRAQLIQSVLFSIQVYWSSLFILPKKIIKALNPFLGLSFGLAVSLEPMGLKFLGRISVTLKMRGFGV